MVNVLHSEQTVSDGIHGMIAFEYANEAARLAATGFTALDIYKIGIELDTNAMYVLVDHDPITWSAVGNEAIAPLLNKVEITCIKGTPGTINVMQAVYSSSWDTVNSRANVELAKADSVSTLPCVGICTQQCTDTSPGKLMIVGVLENVDTSSVLAFPIYLSATTAGGITNIAPGGPNIAQALGVVLNSDASEGVIGVNTLGFRAIEYATTPLALGTAAAGIANEASASDHVHPMPALDETGAPSDNTTNDATTSAHGLMQKYPGGTTDFLRADGSFAAPPAGGESNTASNVGTAGVGVYKQKTGVDLELKKINAGSAKITVTDDTGNDEVDIDVVTGSDANSVCVGNDSRLSDSRIPTGTAGGDLNGTYPNPSVDDGADSTAIHDNVSAEISAITEKTTPVSADLLIIEDSAATNAKKRVQIGNLPGGGVWGNNFADAYTAGPSSTSSATLSTFVSVSLGNLPEGKYIFHWYVEYEGGSNRDDLDILFGYLREGTDAGAIAEIFPNWEDNSYMPFGGSVTFDVPAIYDGDEYTIRIQWAATSGTAWVREGYIMGYRVA